jgi:DNA polymerase alpha-associated DNA helicase A
LNFRVGDEVSVDSEQENQTSLMSGIVVKVVQEFITIAIKNDLPGDLPDRLTLRRLANSISYQRMETALRKLEKEDPSDLYKVLFNLATPTKQKIDVIDFFDKTLNESQMMAVKGCIEADQIFLLHGPPGTGKSYTAVEAIRQLVSRGKKLLVCGPSNISVGSF